MHKIIISIIVAVVVLISFAVFLLPVFVAKNMQFAEDTSVAIINPMQGFYLQVDTADAHYGVPLAKEQGMSLALLACNLNGYQQKPLDEAKLAEITAALDIAKSEKVDVIFRAAYGFAEGMDTVEPRSLDTVLNHIAQISDVIAPYSDIILSVQAGMIGPWGEWHSSSLPEQAKNAVVKAWVSGLPDDNVVIQLRRLEFVRQAVADGVPIQRLGFHNDAFLADDGDMGTYRGDDGIRQQELDWAYDNLAFPVTGGEMPAVSAYTQPQNAVAEFAKLRLTYLNSTYNIAVLDDWKTKEYNGESAYGYIKNRMGSRLFISSVDIQKSVFKSGHMRVQITVGNSGFAPPHPALNFWIAIKQGANVTYTPVKADDVVDVRIRLPDISKDEPFSVGLCAGFGSMADGRMYLLANKDLPVFESTTYFASYEPNSIFYVLQDEQKKG